MYKWNPKLYLKFKEERTQPVKDLIIRIKKQKPEKILDIGCGPGNSTIQLKKRWNESHVIGLDSSKTMLAKAKKDYPDLDWILGDTSEDLSFLGKFDIIFSNAAIQWMPDHEELLTKFIGLLNDYGVLAIQIPNTTYMPIRIAVKETSLEYNWFNYFKNMNDGLYYEDLNYYYDIISPLVNEMELWETNYNHVISGYEAIVEWYKSTGMRPYLEKLKKDEQEEFTEDVLSKIKSSYKLQKNGNLLFPFRRLFFIAYK